jgi:hypothetical protein
MRIIRDDQRLPKPILLMLAAVGWASVIYLAYVLGLDSWERTASSVAELRQGLPQTDPFNQRYLDNPVLTLLHTIPGILFSVLGPLQFMSPIREYAPAVHRTSGRIFLPIGILSGVAAVLMGLRFPIWGWTINQAITLIWAGFMVFAFCKAYLLVRARRFQFHREWMIRGFAAGFGVGFFRLVLNDVLLPNGVEFTQAWNTVVIISGPITLGFAEFWIRATRPKGRAGATLGETVEILG